MEIPEKLVKFKYHIAVALVLLLSLSSLVFLAPRFLSLLAYFWPLFLSTALFLSAVVIVGRTSPPPSAAGEDLLDYVAGPPDEAVLETSFQNVPPHDDDAH